MSIVSVQFIALCGLKAPLHGIGDQATEDSPFAIEALRNHIHALTASVRGGNGPTNNDAAPPSPSKGASPSVPTLAAASSMIQNYLPQALKNASMNGEAGHVKARREAKAADEEYREALGELEDMRLGIEARLESGMGQWEGWERERLKAVKTGKMNSNYGARGINSRLGSSAQSFLNTRW